MQADDGLSPALRQRLDEAIAEYLAAAEAGAPLDREELLARYVDVAEHLRTFFTAQDQRQSGSASGEAVTIDSAATAPSRPQTPSAGPRADPARQFGDYELLEEIARGGMGVVWKARHVKLQRIVALKMILAGQLAGPDDVQRFYAEAEAAAQLDHPGIVPIYEIGQHEGQHFFAMAYVEGQSLAAKVAAGPLPPREAAELASALAVAVHYAHEQGVIHRDLKPGNVLSDKNGQPRITDFGLAKRIHMDSSLTATGQILGTPSYMPPEQAAGKTEEIGPAADVYALGAILYTLLTGRPPFQAANVMDTLRQVIEREPVPPRQLNPSVLVDLDTICLKCLQKDHRRRYASARDLSDDLQRYLRGEPIQARPVGRLAASWRWARRHPARAGLLAASAVALLAFVALGVGFSYQARLQVANHNLENEKLLLGIAKGELEQANSRLEGALAAETNARGDVAQAKDEIAKAKDELDRVLYFRRVMLAYAAWRSNEIARAKQLLSECPVAQRNWEWHYVQRLCESQRLTLKGHSVAFSPDGKWIATGRGRGSVAFWDAERGQEAFTLDGDDGALPESFVPNFPAPGMAFSPDGKLLASRSHDHAVVVWDVRTRNKVHAFRGHTHTIHSVVFSPDGRRIASASLDGTVKIWDFDNRGAPVSLDFGGHALAFSSDGKLLAGVNMAWRAVICDAVTGKEVQSITTRGANTVAFSRDSKRLATGLSAGIALTKDHDKTTVWDVATGKSVLTLGGGSVAFSPDGQRIATGACGNGGIAIWDSSGGQLPFDIRGDAAGFITFSPDGKRIASVADLQVKVWDAEHPQEAFVLKAGDVAVSDIALSRDERRLVSAGGGIIKIWDMGTLREARTINAYVPNPGMHIAISSDGKRIVSSGWEGNPAFVVLKLWDVESGNQLPFVKEGLTQVGAVAFLLDGKRIAAATQDGTIFMWNPETGAEVHRLQSQPSTTGFAVSRDSRHLASTTSPTRITVWNIASGQPEFTLDTSQAFTGCLAFDSEGTHLAVTTGSGIKVWDLVSRKEALTLEGRSWSSQLQISPDGKRVARYRTLWDVQSGHEALTLNAPASARMIFTSDSKRLIGGCSDGTIRIWETGPRKP